MAVTFDAVGPTSAGQTAAGVAGTTTTTWSHTCTGSNLVLLVGVAVGIQGGGAGTQVASASYNGVAMTSVGSKVDTNPGVGDGFIQMFSLAAPATGANTVSVSVTNTTTSVTLSVGSVSYTGVDQTTPLGTPATGQGASTSASVNVTGTVAGNVVVDAAAGGSGFSASGSGSTNRWRKNSNTLSAGGNGCMSDKAAGGTVTVSETLTSDQWAIAAVELLAVASAAPGGIFVRSVGTPQAAVNTGTASISTTPTLPAGTVSGDRVFIVTHNSPATTTPTTPTNWTLVDSQSLGTGTLGATAGPRRTSVYWRDYDGVWTMPSVVLPSATAPAMLTQSVTLGVTAGRFAVPASGFGSDVTVTTTPYSATAGSVVPFSIGDLALVTIVGPGLSTLSAEALTATGATFGTVTEQYDAASSGATNGVHGAFVTAPVTAGSATAAAVATGTVSTSGQSDGGSIFIRQAAVFADLIHHDRARFRASLW